VGVFKSADGTRVTKTTVPTTAIDPLDLPKVISEDLYDTRSYGASDAVPEGSIKRLLLKAGAIVTQRYLNTLFPLATVSEISPANGAAAGGTVVTITGSDLDGVTAVNFDGVAGTALTVTDDDEITVTTPAGTAGPADVELVDDAGNVTVTGGFTYA